MMNSKENFQKINTIFIVLIASTIFFRSFCTLFILFFAVYNLIHFKFLKWPSNTWKYICILSLPLVFEILFFWNNSDFNSGFKSLEKYTSLLIFSIFILGSYQQLSFYKILNQYRYLLTAILSVLLIRFAIVDQHLVQKYISGIHLWEMGYEFAKSFKNHAPAVNMHVAFLIVANVFFLIKKQTLKSRIINVLILAIGVFSLLILNTRISLALAILGSLIIVFDYFTKQFRTFQIIKYSTFFALIIAAVLFVSFKSNPYMKEKYSSVTFAHIDKIGKLDEIENPEVVVFNAFVTRLSIWKAAFELGSERPLFGYGSADGKKEVVKYFEDTNQHFLAKYEFPVHNQILDFFVKFGIFGGLMAIIYQVIPIVIGIRSRNIILFCFGMIFFISNLFDDFLIRFDGIIFFGIWTCLGYSYYIKKKLTLINI